MMKWKKRTVIKQAAKSDEVEMQRDELENRMRQPKSHGFKMPAFSHNQFHCRKGRVEIERKPDQREAILNNKTDIPPAKQSV